MRFDLADLSLFRHVVEAGSITGGAERMHLALAAASTRIRNMEAVLGTALLLREREGGRPADAARPDPGAPCQADAAAGRAHARRARRICPRPARPDPAAVQHQCADGI